MAAKKDHHDNNDTNSKTFLNTEQLPINLEKYELKYEDTEQEVDFNLEAVPFLSNNYLMRDPLEIKTSRLICVIPGCTEGSSDSITYHRVQAKWLDFIRQYRRDEGWNPTTASRICSLHFDPVMFKNRGIRCHLEEWALPTLVRK